MGLVPMTAYLASCGWRLPSYDPLVTRDEYIQKWCEFKGSGSWEARRCWEYGERYGDQFHFLNLPSLAMPTCNLKCRQCKAVLEIDYEHIRDALVYDYDCKHCYNCNTYSSVSVVEKLNRFRRRCQRYEMEWERLNQAPADDDDDISECALPCRPRRGVTAKIRFTVLCRDGFRCRYCGATPTEVTLHVDHMKSRADGGSDDLSNLVTACADCNLGKGSTSILVT